MKRKQSDTMKLPKDFWQLNLMDAQILCCLLEIGFDKKLGKQYDKKRTNRANKI